MAPLTNLKRLTVEFASKIQIDAAKARRPGVPVNEAVMRDIFATSGESVTKACKQAARWTADAVQAVRLAPDPNPWKNATDEEIAGEILRAIDERRAKTPTT